jgi:hypothetical protein
VFVLPLSPFTTRSAGLSVGPAKAPRPWWRAPVLAALGSLALLLVGFVLVWPLLTRPDDSANQDHPDDQPLTAQIETGRRALGQGKFRLARRLLERAIERRKDQPESLSRADSRRLNQLHRQADLLSRLLSVSLEEIARQGRLVRDPAEWDLQMEDYRGRSVIFDDMVRRNGQGRPVLMTYVVDADEERVRLALEDLTLLQDLPLDDEPRLIFGARVSDCKREQGGGWVIRFEPDSGVLLTELDAVAACLPGPPDKALEQTLARQQRWLDEAVVHPARP